MRDYTDNGIEYDSQLTGPDGMRFVLLPVRGVDTQESVDVAKKELKRDRDVVGRIGVEWQIVRPKQP